MKEKIYTNSFILGTHTGYNNGSFVYQFNDDCEGINYKGEPVSVYEVFNTLCNQESKIYKLSNTLEDKTLELALKDKHTILLNNKVEVLRSEIVTLETKLNSLETCHNRSVASHLHTEATLKELQEK